MSLLPIAFENLYRCFCRKKLYTCYMMRFAIWYHLYNFEKREKHPQKSVFSKIAGFNLKVTSLVGVFHVFKLNRC